MPFSADDLRHRPEQSYGMLYAYLSHQAKKYLHSLQYDAFEVDMVVGHVVEQLVRTGALGDQGRPSSTAFERMSSAQFYSFLNHMIRNKAIDRLRAHHMNVATFSELESPDSTEVDDNPLNETVASLWGRPPFATPEAETLLLASQQELRAVLIHCIQQLAVAPHQLEAILEEIQEAGCDEVLHVFFDGVKPTSSDASLAHASQNKDHAHKKLRLCLQQQNSNLAVRVALRLIQYGVRVPDKGGFRVALHTVIGEGLSESDVQAGLRQLTVEKVLDWHSEESIAITVEQMKHLKRYYREE